MPEMVKSSRLQSARKCSFCLGRVMQFPTTEALELNELLSALKLDSVKLVVLNLHSSVSASTITPPEVYRELTTRFPHAVNVGKYLICWRE